MGNARLQVQNAAKSMQDAQLQTKYDIYICLQNIAKSKLHIYT